MSGRPVNLAGATGLEPATFGVTGQPFSREIKVLQLPKSGLNGAKVATPKSDRRPTLFRAVARTRLGFQSRANALIGPQLP